tara:strand:+ start:20991 stop:21362 length:372 start_codon:yes stop_codon:yes gene_type:complete
MSASARKDYGAGAVIDPSQETVKRINNMNNPYSVQQLGLDKSDDNGASPKYIAITSESLDALTANTRVLLGNREGVVKSVNTPVATLVDCVITIRDKEKVDIDTTYTKAELLASPIIFFAINV